MKDGSDAIADWPLLNALLNTACGASWVSLHHGGVEGVPGRDLRGGEKHVAGALHVGQLDGEHLVDDGKERLERRGDRVPAGDRRIPVQDLLEHLRVGHQRLPVDHGTLKEAARGVLGGSVGAHEVHRDVRVDEDHGVSAA